MFGRTWDRYYIFIAKNTLKPRFFFACGELNLKLMHSLQYSLNNCNRFCFKVSSRKWGTSSNDFVYLSKYELWNNFLPLPLTEKTCYPSVINVTVPNEKCLFQIKLLLGPPNRKLAAPPLVRINTWPWLAFTTQMTQYSINMFIIWDSTKYFQLFITEWKHIKHLVPTVSQAYLCYVDNVSLVIFALYGLS